MISKLLIRLFLLAACGIVHGADDVNCPVITPMQNFDISKVNDLNFSYHLKLQLHIAPY